MRIPVGMIVKQIIDEKRLKAKDVGDKIGISRQAVYQSYAKMIFSEGEIIRWSDALGVTKEDFIDRWKNDPLNQDSASKESSTYLLEHLTALEEQFKRLLTQIDVKDRQIDTKDQQIQSLTEMLKMTLGKPELGEDDACDVPVIMLNSLLLSA